MNIPDLKKLFTTIPKRNLIILGAAFVLIAGDVGFYYYKGAAVSPKQTAQAEVKELLAQVGTLIVLPADEQPVVATVNDPELLKGQAFFANAQKGDKVLIYNGARKAILFRPTLNKVIDVAPLSQAVPTVSTTPPVK